MSRRRPGIYCIVRSSMDLAALRPYERCDKKDLAKGGEGREVRVSRASQDSISSRMLDVVADTQILKQDEGYALL